MENYKDQGKIVMIKQPCYELPNALYRIIGLSIDHIGRGWYSIREVDGGLTTSVAPDDLIFMPELFRIVYAEA